jgi:hypothetical protein
LICGLALAVLAEGAGAALLLYGVRGLQEPQLATAAMLAFVVGFVSHLPVCYLTLGSLPIGRIWMSMTGGFGTAPATGGEVPVALLLAFFLQFLIWWWLWTRILWSLRRRRIPMFPPPRTA